MEMRRMSCCAVRELNELAGETDFEETVKGVKRDATIYGHYDISYDWEKRGQWIPEEIILPAFVIFTQAGTPREEVSADGPYGDKFAQYITDNKLGTVQVTTAELNPNSGNFVKVFVWTVNREALMKIKAPKEKN